MNRVGVIRVPDEEPAPEEIHLQPIDSLRALSNDENDAADESDLNDRSLGDDIRLPEQSSNEEFSVMRRTAERQSRSTSFDLGMKFYTSYMWSACLLAIGFILSFCGLMPSLFLESMPTNVYLYEHR